VTLTDHGPTQGLCPHPSTCPYGQSTGNSLYIKCNNVTLAWRCGGKAGLYQCTSVPNTTAGPLFPIKQSCLESCKAPPPPPPAPGPPPPAPVYDKPYLRFAMVIPVPQLVDCTVTQGSTTYFISYSEEDLIDIIAWHHCMKKSLSAKASLESAPIFGGADWLVH